MSIEKKKGGEEDIPQLEKLRNEEILEMVLSKVSEISGQTRMELTENPGRRKNSARMAAVYLIATITSINYREIGFIFHLSEERSRDDLSSRSFERRLNWPCLCRKGRCGEEKNTANVRWSSYVY